MPSRHDADSTWIAPCRSSAVRKALVRHASVAHAAFRPRSAVTAIHAHSHVTILLAYAMH
jgi:hypothetical protein